jgi:hypothetical protein
MRWNHLFISIIWIIISSTVYAFGGMIRNKVESKNAIQLTSPIMKTHSRNLVAINTSCPANSYCAGIGKIHM